MNRLPKISIPKQDLVSFLKEDLQIDPFWNDLIDNGNKKKKRR